MVYQLFQEAGSANLRWQAIPESKICFNSIVIGRDSLKEVHSRHLSNLHFQIIHHLLHGHLPVRNRIKLLQAKTLSMTRLKLFISRNTCRKTHPRDPLTKTLKLNQSFYTTKMMKWALLAVMYPLLTIIH